MSSDDVVLCRYISNMNFIIQLISFDEISFDEISFDTFDYTMFDIVQDTLEGEFSKLNAHFIRFKHSLVNI